MPNCETHLCPLAVSDTLFPICPIEWVFERVDDQVVKDIIFEDEQLDLVFNDGLVMTVEKIGRQVEERKLAWLEYEADEYQETFCGAKLVSVTAIPTSQPEDTCYLEIAFQKSEDPNEYLAIVEFFGLYSLDQNKPITYFGEEHGPQ